MNDYFTALINTLGYLQSDVIQQVMCVLHEARLNKRLIFLMGNGGSASTASHFAADLSKNTYNPDYPSFRAISLADNMAIFSAYANDEGYENVFSQQVASLANPGDIVIAISASGNSMNVVRAVEAAKKIGATTIGFTGFTGGKVGNLVDIHLHVPSTIIEQVEDIHLLLEHMICKNLRENIDEINAQVQATVKIGRELLEPKSVFYEEKDSVTFQLFNNLTQGLNNQYDLQSQLYRCLQLSLEGSGANSGSMIVADDEGHVIDAATAYNHEILFPKAQEVVDFMECGLAGWVFRNRQAAIVKSTRNDPRWLRRSWDEVGDQSRSAISVPMHGNRGICGVLTLVNSNSGQFSQGHLVMLLAFCTTISLGEKILA